MVAVLHLDYLKRTVNIHIFTNALILLTFKIIHTISICIRTCIFGCNYLDSFFNLFEFHTQINSYSQISKINYKKLLYYVYIANDMLVEYAIPKKENHHILGNWRP